MGKGLRTLSWTPEEEAAAVRIALHGARALLAGLRADLARAAAARARLGTVGEADGDLAEAIAGAAALAEHLETLLCAAIRSGEPPPRAPGRVVRKGAPTGTAAGSPAV